MVAVYTSERHLSSVLSATENAKEKTPELSNTFHSLTHIKSDNISRAHWDNGLRLLQVEVTSLGHSSWETQTFCNPKSLHFPKSFVPLRLLRGDEDKKLFLNIT